jgi:hypothetical protein
LRHLVGDDACGGKRLTRLPRISILDYPEVHKAEVNLRCGENGIGLRWSD